MKDALLCEDMPTISIIAHISVKEKWFKQIILESFWK